MRKISFVLVLCCAAVLAANAQSVSSLPKLPREQVVARVNGVELHGDMLNDYLTAAVGDFSFHGKIQPNMINDYRKDALKRMIGDELLYQEGLRRHIVVRKSRIDAEVAVMRGRYLTPSDFQKALARGGLTLEKLRESIQHGLIISTVIQQDVTSHLKFTNAQLRAYYRKNRARFHEPAKIHISEIYIPAGPDAVGLVGQVRAKALAKNTPNEFYQLASQYSKDDYRVMGGDRGWVHRGRIAPELEKVAFTLHHGQISQPIPAKTGGFFLLRLNGSRPARVVPYAEMRDKIREQLVAQRQAKLKAALRKRLYRNAKIEVLAKF
jgi:parvulin-like peptidyl-prolyl isomerase